MGWLIHSLLCISHCFGVVWCGVVWFAGPKGSYQLCAEFLLEYCKEVGLQDCRILEFRKGVCVSVNRQSAQHI